MAVFFPRFVGPTLVDVVLSEAASAGMEIPQHPVERGAKISDHAWRVPTTVQMECIAQDVTGTWRQLTDLMAQAEPFDIVTGFDLFENMMIEEVSPQRDVFTGQILAVSVKLREMIIVSTAEGPAGPGGDERGRGRSDRGQVQGRRVPASEGRLSRRPRAA